MIINTGQRTDIPAFYDEWFSNRIQEGFVCVRNPYNPNQVSKYRLDPSVVDVIGFCTKNPAPMFPYMALLKGYGQFWYVTITPYGRDIEPHVPDKHKVLDDFRQLVIESGRSSFMYLQNIYAREAEQSLSLALCMAEMMLQGKGAWRIHGGGFAGTTLNFVPLDMVNVFTDTMDRAFGKGASMVLNIRPVGAARLKL